MPDADRNPHVVIFGSSRCQPGEADWDCAAQLGGLIAAAGWTVVTGGYGGSMHAASEAASKAGGHAVGVLCDAFGRDGNPHLTKKISTPDLYARVRGLIEYGDAFVVLPGSTGTLVELAMVWEKMNKGFVAPGPLVCVGEYWKPVVDLLATQTTFDRRFENTDKPPRAGDFVQFASTPSAVMELLRPAFP